MHGYNDTTEPEPPSSRRTPKRYTNTKNSCAIKSLMSAAHTKTQSRPSYTLPFPLPLLLSRGATPPFWFLFSKFPPPLLVFFFSIPCFYWVASSPPQSSAIPSLRLFSLAHLPFQLPAGMHVTSPILSRQTGMRQVYGSTLYPILRHHPLFCLTSPPLPPFFFFVSC